MDNDCNIHRHIILRLSATFIHSANCNGQSQYTVAQFFVSIFDVGEAKIVARMRKLTLR